MPDGERPDGRQGPRRGPGRGWESLAGGAWHGGHRVRRGDVRVALLSALEEGDAHGYELIRRLEQRSGGLWRPSAGSVYPTLQVLDDEGLVVGRDEGGKRVFSLTDRGREAAHSRGRPPWEPEEHRSRRRGGLRHVGELRDAVVQVGMAARQVAVAGDRSQIEAARAILNEARAGLYRLLAGD